MEIKLTEYQQRCREETKRFAREHLQPWVDKIDKMQSTPEHIIEKIKKNGYLGAALPQQWGGGGLDSVSYGIMTEEIGRMCSSVRSMMTVHNMSAQTISKWGTSAQQQQWLPDLCSGKKIIAFALSEENVGSAADTVETEAAADGTDFMLNGAKKWVTYGQIADMFLVFAQCDHKPVALVVERNTPGLSVEPLRDIFGTSGSMIASVKFNNCRVPGRNLIGPMGMGIKFVAHSTLDHGRFSVACGSTGITQACLDACLDYSQRRKQGEGKLKDYQLIRRKLTDMLTQLSTSRMLCYKAAYLRDEGDPNAIMETSLAKYHASSVAMLAARDAVHIHGANGCSAQYPVNRYLRDATVMGIIEGSHEIQQMVLADYAFQRPYQLV